MSSSSRARPSPNLRSSLKVTHTLSLGFMPVPILRKMDRRGHRRPRRPVSRILRGMNSAKPTDTELKARLTPAQYQVTQCSATEPPFRNEFWNHHEAGIYGDVG